MADHHQRGEYSEQQLENVAAERFRTFYQQPIEGEEAHDRLTERLFREVTAADTNN